MTIRLALASVLLVVAAGCGSDGEGDPGAVADAARTDADPSGPDAQPTAPDAPPDAPPAPTMARVTVLTLTSDGLPQVGAVVVFSAPDGGPMTSVVTGEDGTASAAIATGASVTVVWTTVSGARLLTITDLEPGDDLRVGQPGRTTDPTGSRDVALSFVPFDATPMTAFARCSPAGQSVFANRTSAIMRINARCDAPGANDDFVLVSRSGTTNLASVLLDVPQAASQQLPGFEVVDDMVVALSNLPDDIGQVGIRRILRRGGQPFMIQTGVLLDAPVGAATVSIDLGELVAGDDMVMATNVKRASRSRQTLGVKDVRSPSSSYGYDAAETYLPWFEPGVFDPATRRLAWSLSADKPFDLLWMDARYTRGSAGTARSFVWRVISASSTGSLVLPALPAELVGDALPAAGDVAWLAEGRIVDTSDRTYRDLVQRVDLDPWFADDDAAVGTRVAHSTFGCGGRACPEI